MPAFSSALSSLDSPESRSTDVQLNASLMHAARPANGSGLWRVKLNGAVLADWIHATDALELALARAGKGARLASNSAYAFTVVGPAGVVEALR